jgi:hypothetical protein
MVIDLVYIVLVDLCRVIPVFENQINLNYLGEDEERKFESPLPPRIVVFAASRLPCPFFLGCMALLPDSRSMDMYVMYMTTAS